MFFFLDRAMMRLLSAMNWPAAEKMGEVYPVLDSAASRMPVEFLLPGALMGTGMNVLLENRFCLTTTLTPPSAVRPGNSGEQSSTAPSIEPPQEPSVFRRVREPWARRLCEIAGRGDVAGVRPRLAWVVRGAA
jgi:hypothetical protein